MDAIISSAVEEICLDGAAGVALPKLWTLLQPSISSAGLHLCGAVKNALWSRLITLPGLQLQLASGRSPPSPNDPAIASPSDAEKVGVKMIAEEHLRDSCLGIQELKAGGRRFSELQRGLLERIASSRCDGVTQDQLGKEFGVHGKEIFYNLKGLESNGVIVRQSTLVKRGISVVKTNTLYLPRYARKSPNSNPHQRVEITMGSAAEECENQGEDLASATGASKGHTMTDGVTVRDYLPAMETVCNKLDQASGKVLVVSDLKKELGYRKTKGHRLWRNIVNRLKEAKLVEEFHAKVNGHVSRRGAEKTNNCLRLLKKFNLKDFQPKTVTYGYDESNAENFARYNSKKGGQCNEQVMELPLDHQIYDMIDSEGSNGIIVTEIYRRLGINGKKSYPRILEMRSRFEMPMLAECQNRTKAYRIWTFGNSPSPHTSPPAGVSKSKENLTNDEPRAETESNSCIRYLCSSDVSRERKEIECRDSDHDQAKDIVVFSEFDGTSGEVRNITASNLSLPERPLSALAPSSKVHPSQSYPCLDLTTITLQRKDRIISRLEADKFILLVELQRWLDGLETEKSSKMDKKTLLRILESLEKDGLCKSIEFRFPSMSNPSSDRQISVIFHPSSVASIQENLGQIYRKLRDFEAAIRGKGMEQTQGNVRFAPQIISIERPQQIVEGLLKNSTSEAMRSNGYIPAKMVRAKLLHIFIWSLRNLTCGTNSSGSWRDAENPHNCARNFVFDTIIKAMPIELFLQVVGFAGKNNDLVEYCHRGLKLSDLQIEEYKCLMDTTASARLSSLVDILVRLKLVNLIPEAKATDVAVLPLVIVSHALELKPYIEIPCINPCSDHVPSDKRSNFKHHFDLLGRDNVDDYWAALEGYYLEADPNIASQTFPGSAVREGFSTRAWSSVRVMSAEQRLELSNCIAEIDPCKKVSVKECRSIAKKLNLTLGQVLCAAYDKRRSQLRKFSCHPRSRRWKELEKNIDGKASQKRKRSSEYNSQSDLPTGQLVDTQAYDDSMESLTTDDFKENFHEPAGETVMPDVDNDDEGNLLDQGVLFKPTRRGRFLWTDELDRQLVMQYARYRAVRKAEFHRVQWASLSNLPASPNICRRRMAQLKGITSIRDAIMHLCSLLGERYLLYVECLRKGSQNFDGSNQVHDYFMPRDLGDMLAVSREMESDSNSQVECWDDFEDQTIKVAVDEVLRCKNSSKQGNIIEHGSTRKRKYFGSVHFDVCNSTENHLPSLNAGKEKNDLSRDPKKDSGCPSESHLKRLCAHRIPRRVLKFLSSESIGTTKDIAESLSVANAVELLKLIFLSTSAAADVQALLVETLRRFTESDIYAAFNYLREKSFMVVGYGSRPFILSQKFLNSATSSPFPVDTGKRAKNFSAWLHKQTCDNMQLDSDMQCGEILQLFSLVSSGKLSLSACLPEVGIGEVDDSLLKQDKARTSDENKKNDFLWKKDGDLCLRREKGFPGITLVLDCTENEWYKNILPSDGNNQNISLSGDDTSPSTEFSMSQSLWQSINSCVEKLSQTINQKVEPMSPNLIKSVYTEIQQAGEQGLNMKELSERINTQGSILTEIIADTLEMFQLVIKVNAFDCVHIVDSSHKSKYFITTSKIYQKGCNQLSSVKSQLTTHFDIVGRLPLDGGPNVRNNETSANVSVSQDASVPDLSKGSKEFHAKNQIPCGTLDSEVCRSLDALHDERNSFNIWPILPWIDAKGGNNTIMYKGLVRRVLGIVMQNPGILEEDLVQGMDVLNPQSCRRLLELMILDNHLTVRKVAHHNTSMMPPSILTGLMKFTTPKSEPLFRRHLFANPMSAKHL